MAARPRSLALGLASLLLFVVVTSLVLAGTTQVLDARLALTINNAYLGPTLNQLMILSSEYGREYFWVPIVGIMLLLGDRGTKLLAIELAALFVVGIVLGEVMKSLAFRPRPYATVEGIVRRLPMDTDSSYPSGHALMVSIGASFALMRFRNKAVATLLTIEASIVCYSRVYVGVHYPLDVLGGILLALAVTAIGLPLIERYVGPVLRRLADIAVKALRDGPIHL